MVKFYNRLFFKVIPVLIFAIICFSGFRSLAQITYSRPASQPVAAAPATEYKNLKVIEEYTDSKGNNVRKIQYSQGVMRITETIITPKPIKVGYRVPINPDTMQKDLVTVIVSKSGYNVQVRYRDKVVRSYKAVFGPKPQDNKKMEGDRCTPEGWFTITNKNPASKYTKFLGIDYPNAEYVQQFNQMKAQGLIPASARIGGNVGIHGIWTGGDNLIELGVGWTDGCVALKNSDIEELYQMCGVGTKVYIRK